MKKILICLIALLMVLTAGCGKQATDTTSSEGKIIVGLDDGFPPFGFRDEKGDIIGFDIDLAKEIAKRLNRPIEFKAIQWSNKDEELNSGNIDMIMNGLEITDERRHEMLFSKPYIHSGCVVFVRYSPGENNIKDRSDLAGKIVGIQKGSTAQAYINDDNELRFSIRSINLYEDSDTAFKALLNRQVDAVVGDETNGRYYIFKHQLQDKISDTELPVGDKGQIAIGFRKNDMTLRNEIQNAFDAIIKDGTAGKISERWFGKNLIKN